MDKTIAYKVKNNCRLCGSLRLNGVLNLGQQPLANSYLNSFDLLESNEDKYELILNTCLDCGHNQLSIVVNPDMIYKNYLYVSGTPETFHMHCQDLADKYTDILQLGEADLVVDIAGNDGTLLSKFINKEKFINVVNVDPAKNLAESAREKGIDVFSLFFNEKIAKKITWKYNKKAKLIIAQNVFAHVDDLDSFMNGINELLDNTGIFVVEFPYAIDMFNRTAFDTIYHEHLSYFQLSSLQKFLNKKGFYIHEVDYFKNIHGGTVRLSICKSIIHEKHWIEFRDSWYKKFIPENINNFFRIDKLCNLSDKSIFSLNVVNLKEKIKILFDNIYDSKKTIHILGASAKGNTFLNYCFDKEYFKNKQVICYDENRLKCDKYLPGTCIKIKHPDDILKNKKHPDYIFITVWNFKDELIQRFREKYNYKGNFIIAIPNLEII